jgi:formylglycine-generating enzyme required for sulfatase activity
MKMKNFLNALLTATIILGTSTMFLRCSDNENEDPAEPAEVSRHAGEPDMVSVPAGTFTMGSPNGVGYSDEQPEHRVTLSAFKIGKYEVTQGQWAAVMGSNPSYFKSGDNYPVETVSWDDIVGTTGAYTELNGIRYYADGFIYKLNSLTGKSYRLPTEAEWEYAAQGGKAAKTYDYSGGNTIGNVAWYGDNSGSTTHPVGTKAANELGVYDMSGNVWEWCSDWFGSYGSGAQTNPTGPATGSYRVDRGGSRCNLADPCRVATRCNDAPERRSNNLGFRHVLVP